MHKRSRSVALESSASLLTLTHRSAAAAVAQVPCLLLVSAPAGQSYEAAVVRAIMTGGCNASRASLVGAVVAGTSHPFRTVSLSPLAGTCVGLDHLLPRDVDDHAWSL